MKKIAIFILFAVFAISAKAQNAEQISDKADMSTTRQDIQKQLEPDEAVIEFVYSNYDKDQPAGTVYDALVLRSGSESPARIPLCNQKELDSVLQVTVKDTKLQTESRYVDRGKKLYQLIWKALEKELADVKTVYYSLAGLLHKIAFNAIPTDKDSILLSDKYNLHLVSSTSEIARLKKKPVTITEQDTVVVYGGLVYGAKQSTNNIPFWKNRQKRGGFSGWQYLSGTKAEADSIISILKGKHIPYRYYTDSLGTEESFKQLNGTKTAVIHLATHGFFLPDIENKTVEELVQRLGGNKENPFENPLLRSGLIMSDANKQWISDRNISEEGMEDGILTADEISRLDLTKTKLAVLSASESGLGEINSEGVFGLQRAFKLAGVESLIMSLRSVADDSTAELMTIFYKEWISGQNKQAAFKTAQQKVREKYQSPYYWAAFVMMD